MVLPAGSPPQSAMFYIALPCLPRYIKSRTFLQLYGDNAKVKKKSSAIYHPAQGLGEPWLLMANAYIL